MPLSLMFLLSLSHFLLPLSSPLSFFFSSSADLTLPSIFYGRGGQEDEEEEKEEGGEGGESVPHFSPQAASQA